MNGMKQHNTKESGEWEKRFDEYFYDADHSLTQRQIEHIKKNLIEPLLANTEKQAMLRQRHYDEQLMKVADKEAYQRGADEMMERCIAAVPEESIVSLFDFPLKKFPETHAESDGWNAYREAILTSLRGLQTAPPLKDLSWESMKELIKAHKFFVRKSQHYIMGDWNEYQKWFSKWNYEEGRYQDAPFNWQKFRYMIGFPKAYIKFMCLTLLDS